LRKTERFT
jgi:hypothetical protein